METFSIILNGPAAGGKSTISKKTLEKIA